MFANYKIEYRVKRRGKRKRSSSPRGRYSGIHERGRSKRAPDHIALVDANLRYQAVAENVFRE